VRYEKVDDRSVPTRKKILGREGILIRKELKLNRNGMITNKKKGEDKGSRKKKNYRKKFPGKEDLGS